MSHAVGVRQVCKNAHIYDLYKGKGRALDIAPQVDMATTEALGYMARIKQRHTYLPYTFPAIAGTHFTDPERMEG